MSTSGQNDLSRPVKRQVLTEWVLFSYFPTSFGDHVKAEIEILDPRVTQNFKVAGDIGSEIIFSGYGFYIQICEASYFP